MSDNLPGLTPRHPLVYALNFAPANQVHTLGAIWQFTHEMDNLSRLSEPQVAAVKIPWWHEELERWQRGEARHPATRALADLAGQEAVVLAGHTLLNAAAVQQTRPRCATESDFWDRCGQHALGMNLVAAYVGAEAAVRDGYQAVGAAALAIERLLGTPADARVGRILLPLDWVAAAQLDTRSLSTPGNNARFNDICHRLAATASEQLANGAGRIRTAAAIAQHRYALVLAALYDACAQQLLRSASPELSWPGPLRQLWVAWQAARHSG